MKSIFRIIIVFSFFYTHSQNLLDTSSWVSGSGSILGFEQWGTNENNLREIASDPYGNQSLIWKAIGPVSSAAQSGGFTGSNIQVIDNTKSYRFTVWVQKKGILSSNGTGKTWFGMGANFRDYGGFHAKKVDNSQANNSHFFSGFLPELNHWYLMVGYIHGKNYADTSNILGGIYDAETGDKVESMQQEFKFTDNTDKISIKTYLFGEYYDIGNQLIWNPSLYAMDNPEMPSIAELTAPSVAAANSSNNGVSVWTNVLDGINYNSGNVGIGIDTPDVKLTVNGNIRAKEVKVETANWPDYVFNDNYKLPSLKEVEFHIKNKGHLVNMPSAKRIEKEGLELGEMNRLLLEKIEELTLYIIFLKSELDQQQLKITKIENHTKLD
ncbi:MAG: hypothetical protein ABJI22_12295 [Maribacter sp.]